MHGVDYFVELSESSCLQTHDIDPHTSLHDQPNHKKPLEQYKKFSEFGSLQFTPRKFSIQTRLLSCPQHLCLVHIVLECIPNKDDLREMLALPNRLLC